MYRKRIFSWALWLLLGIFICSITSCGSSSSLDRNNEAQGFIVAKDIAAESTGFDPALDVSISESIDGLTVELSVARDMDVAQILYEIEYDPLTPGLEASTLGK